MIETVYDIGAHEGSWTVELRRALPDAQFFLFEANAAHSDALERTGARFFTVLLSSEEKPVDFFASGGSGDSSYRELTTRYEGVTPTTLHATTLDQMVDTHELPAPDLIKADVQGAELDVLTGARKTLAHAKLVLLECPILPYNLGAPAIDEYFRFMDENGFTVLKFVDELWPDGRMRHVDVLFGNVGLLPRAD